MLAASIRRLPGGGKADVCPAFSATLSCHPRVRRCSCLPRTPAPLSHGPGNGTLVQVSGTSMMDFVSAPLVIPFTVSVHFPGGRVMPPGEYLANLVQPPVPGKVNFLQVAVYGITYLEKGGGRRGYGVIRRYRVRASPFRLNVPADGTEVRQNIEFSEVLGLCVGNEAVLRSEDDFSSSRRRLHHRKNVCRNQADVADIDAVPSFFPDGKVCFPLVSFMLPGW